MPSKSPVRCRYAVVGVRRAMEDGGAPQGRRGHFLASLVIPVLIVLSIQSSTGSHPLEVEHFEKNEANLRGTTSIDGIRHSVYAFNIEEYESPGCCADEERGWYPNLLNSAERVSVVVRMTDEDGDRYEAGNHYGGELFCSRGLDACGQETTKEGKWLALEDRYFGSMGYVAYQDRWFSDAKLLVAVQEPYVPFELQVELDKQDNPGQLALSFLLVPFGATTVFAAFTSMGRGDLARSMLFMNHHDNGVELPYEVVASNAFLCTLVAAFYLNFTLWSLSGDDFWDRIRLVPFALVLTLFSPVVGIAASAVPEHLKGKKPHILGALVALPFCFFAMTAALFMITGPNG